MRKLTILVAVLIHLLGENALAREVQIVAEFRSPLAGTFKYVRNLTAREAERMGHPTDQEMRPYKIAAQKALAEREGYSERMYGPDHHRLLTGVKFYGLAVLDATSGLELYASPN